ncbi:GNAT family N-acetyltransferase [Tunturibacter empetritectus]|uniref:Ribosomal-protein-alanine N-acetyltransferase n=1 Tax=Tunturiibacter empetritectus TaxID=3069691 RepID=A0A7W8II19_9BACT|nr:GNAT family N-acetyltransferase [Edaphobacter lichenicola]MBB5316686.1 ribosomal-protein-alanine N-acetyltransferase [Edaphobacter lichenicola]
MSFESYRIRAVNAGDLVGVMRLERATPEAPHWAEAEYAAIVSSDGSAEAGVRRCLFVAEAKGNLLGFAVGKVVVSGALRLAELESVAVSASARRVGVGRALCEAVISWCRDQDATEMELEVRAGGVGAVALYQGLGFAVVGQRSGYYRDPTEDALLMQLRLAGDE